MVMKTVSAITLSLALFYPCVSIAQSFPLVAVVSVEHAAETLLDEFGPRCDQAGPRTYSRTKPSSKSTDNLYKSKGPAPQLRCSTVGFQ
jgi:hypothetical protein